MGFLVVNILNNTIIINSLHTEIKHSDQSFLTIILRKIIGMKGESISDECMENLAKGRLTER